MEGLSLEQSAHELKHRRSNDETVEQDDENGRIHPDLYVRSRKRLDEATMQCRSEIIPIIYQPFRREPVVAYFCQEVHRPSGIGGIRDKCKHCFSNAFDSFCPSEAGRNDHLPVRYEVHFAII